jgi:DNA-binding CsgD family transcriptional regulator
LRLSHTDFDGLHHCILEMHDLAESGSLLDRAPDLLSELIPSDYFAIFEAEIQPAPALIRFKGVWETSRRVDDDMIQRLAHYFPQHPFTRVGLGPGPPSALMHSDFYTVRELHNQEFFYDCWRPAGMERTLAIASPKANGVTFLSAHRRAQEKDFGERDRQVLELVMPHFDQALRTCRRIAEARPQANGHLQDHGLTRRESEVARWLGEGKANAEIAAILGTEPRTVEKHVEHILAKLGVENRTAAAVVVNGANGR